MANAEDTQVVVELTHHSLHALRATGGTIEAGGECLLENKPGIEALLTSVAPAWKEEGVQALAAIWPDSVGWHLSTDTEAMLDRSTDSLCGIAAKILKDYKTSMALATANAGDGGEVTQDGMDKYVLAFSQEPSMARISGTLEELKIASGDPSPAAFAHLGAIADSLAAAGGKGSVVLWDLGTSRSHLLLVTAKGVQAVVPSELGLEAIFEAVQSALRLKFRGAGERLFFNENYDFTDAGPKIGGIVGGKLKASLGNLPTLRDGPPALTCLGLTGKQGWFAREVAAAAGLAPLAIDLSTVAKAMGASFKDSATQAAFSVTSLGILARLRGQRAWNPPWEGAEPPAEDTLPASEREPAPEPVPEPEPESEPEPAPRAQTRPPVPPVRAKPSISLSSDSTPSIPLPAGPAGPKMRPPAPPRSTTPPMPVSSGLPPPPSFGAAPPPPSFGAPPPAPAASAPPPPSFAAPPPAPAQPPAPTLKVRTAPLTPPKPPSFSNPGFVLHEDPISTGEPGFPAPPGAQQAPPAPGFPAPQAAPPPALPPSPVALPRIAPVGTTPPHGPVTSLPFEAAKLKPGVSLTTPPFPMAEQEPRSKAGLYIGIACAAALLFATLAVVLEERNEKIKAADQAQAAELAQKQAEQLLKEAEKAKEEADDNHRKELEIAIKITKEQVEADTRRQILAELETERLTKLPGTLVITTEPAGASVSIDGAAPLLSPVKAEGVAKGPHHIKVTLAGHDPVALDAEVRAGKTTEVPLVTLQQSYGSVSLSSSPDNLEYSIRPSGNLLAKPVATGRTPASVNLDHGDYTVTISRPGCRDHVQNLTVEKGEKYTLSTKYLDGSLELTSDPSGAQVYKDGSFLGTTPLALHDLSPRQADFNLTLPGYDPTPVSCQIPEGDTLKLEAQLLRKDRVFKASEAKDAPQSIDAPAPVLSAEQRKLGADLVLSLVVRTDGAVSDVEVVKTTDDDIARRCKAAVEKWRYRPGTAPDGRTVNVRIEVPFSFPASGS